MAIDIINHPAIRVSPHHSRGVLQVVAGTNYFVKAGIPTVVPKKRFVATVATKLVILE
jgi:hypothetical protein